jgi:hypothetical protein
LLVAITAGIVGALAAVYLYDRGMSKGNDLAMALIGLLTFGTFAFVVTLTVFWSRRGIAWWRVAVGALSVCFCLLLGTTILFSSGYDDYYAIFFVAGWVAVACSGLLALAACRYLVSRCSRTASEDSAEHS